MVTFVVLQLVLDKLVKWLDGYGHERGTETTLGEAEKLVVRVLCAARERTAEERKFRNCTSGQSPFAPGYSRTWHRMADVLHCETFLLVRMIYSLVSYARGFRMGPLQFISDQMFSCFSIAFYVRCFDMPYSLHLRAVWSCGYMVDTSSQYPIDDVPKLLMKTTSTAQYAAEAAKSSCRAAFVNSDIAAEKRSVNTMRTPMASKTPVRVPKLVSSYIATTGSTSNMKMIQVMSKPTKLSIREEE